MKNKRIYIGILLASILLNIISQGIPTNIIGLFFPTMIKELGESQTSVSAIVSFSLIGGVLTIGFYSKLYTKHSLRKVVLGLGILASISYMLVYLTDSITVIYVLSFLMGSFGLGASALAAPMLITKWFDDKRATAMGIAIAGSGLGPTIIAPLIITSIGQGGYRLGYLVLGLVVLAIILLSFLLIKDSPEVVGLEPYRDKSSTKKAKKEKIARTSTYDYTLKEASKTLMFYPFVLFCFLVCIVINGILIQLPSYFGAIGFDPKQIAMVISLYALITGLGKIITGISYDKLGYNKSNTLFFGAMLIAFILLGLVPLNYNLVYLFILFAGLGFGVGAVTVPLFVSSMFGNKYYPQIYTVFTIIVALGAIVGAIYSGFIIDKLGYGALLSSSICLVISSYVLIQLALKFSENDQKKREKMGEHSTINVE